MIEDEVVGWHHRHDGHESAYSQGYGTHSGSLCTAHRRQGREQAEARIQPGFYSPSHVPTAVCNVGDLGWEESLEKGMATHSSILAWRIPWTEEPGGLQSIGSQRVGHN